PPTVSCVTHAVALQALHQPSRCHQPSFLLFCFAVSTLHQSLVAALRIAVEEFLR
ncbi:hypothetical protein PIB30_064471, partial [Stylosanthes scabra]|nr:hypothetical protein [Stylosanthes scabra]